MVQHYEQNAADRVNGRSGVVSVKIAPGRIRGDHSMSAQEGKALADWISGLRVFMGMQ